MSGSQIRRVAVQSEQAVRYTVIDRDGYNHLVLFAPDGVWGYENLGSHESDGEKRGAFHVAILERIKASDTGTYQGYLWRRLPASDHQ